MCDDGPVKHTRALVTIILAAVAMSGCAGPFGEAGGVSPAPSRSGAVSAVPTPAAPSVPSPTEPTPSGAEATLSTRGYGDLVIGDPVPVDTGLVEWDPDACSGRFAAWLPAVPDETWPHGTVVVDTDGQAERGNITGVRVYDSSIETDAGAHTGITLDELRAIYPGLAEVTQPYYEETNQVPPSEVYSVSDEFGQLAFEIDDGTVFDIFVTSTDWDANYLAIAATDGGTSCPAGI